MTNEEITIRHTCGADIEYSDIMAASRERAEWKEQQYSQDGAYNRGIRDACQQFKEYLEKKKDNYMHHREMWQQDTFEWGCYDSQIDTIDQIINELFGE